MEVCEIIDQMESKFIEMSGTIAEEWYAEPELSTKVWRPKFDKLREQTKCLPRPKNIEEQYKRAWW